jgi:hypothetical protein
LHRVQHVACVPNCVHPHPLAHARAMAVKDVSVRM